MIGHYPKAVLQALARCESFEDVRAAGILFHGTCETIEGDLGGGPYDGVFWTARTPSVAQAYIPRSGITSMMPVHDKWDREERVKPDKNDSWIMRWAFEKSGATRDDLAVEWDGWRPYSWSIPKGWPTIGDLEDHLRDLGYQANNEGFFQFSTSYEDGIEVLKPADWSLPGHLLIILPKDLDTPAPAWSEDALGYSNHNRVGDFGRFAQDGIDAIHMGDQLQSDHWGNVGHDAVGVLPAGLEKLSWLALPAIRHDGADFDTWRLPETAEFAALMREVNPGYRTLREIEEQTVAASPEL